MKNIYIVTPSFNSAETIQRTLDSVINQNSKFNIFYHVQDGGSKDGTIKIIDNFSKKIKSENKNIHFTYHSSKDDGMYDAIEKGIRSFGEIDDNHWVTWINSDDFFEEDCFSNIYKTTRKNPLIEWITGRPSTLKLDGEKKILNYDLFNSYILKNGICDGGLWNFLQQEGTFFKFKLWKKSSINFGQLSFAGDWNLWFEMAKHAEIYCFEKPLATFCERAGQLSQNNKIEYGFEIQSILKKQEREIFFKRKHKPEDLIKKVVSCENFYVKNESLQGHYNYRKSLLEGMIAKRAEHKGKGEYLADKIKTENGLVFLDAEWQYPAITEKNAFMRMKNFKIPGNVCYLAFPWATLIDLENTKKPKAHMMEGLLEKISFLTSKYEKVITVCQHILFKKFIPYFEQTNVTDVFWSHCTIQDHEKSISKTIKIHPFPLYPVNIVSIDEGTERDILFNFVGAEANQYYLTNIRNIIIDELKEHPLGYIRSRNSWHYNDIVYKQQISDSALKNPIDIDKTREFEELLRRSIFTLCPSGSGPNSIRLWESIGSGSIPVVISDNYLPPGNIDLWKQAVVFCEENTAAIQELPQKLLEISSNMEKINHMRNALKQLWFIYKPENFTYDIKKKIISYGERENKIERIFKKSISELLPFDDENFILNSLFSRLLIEEKIVLKDIEKNEIRNKLIILLNRGKANNFMAKKLKSMGLNN